MLGKGKKTKAWDRERAKLKQKFMAAGITYCEVVNDPTTCWRSIGLGFAHVAKRNELQEGELSKVVISCPPCHHWLDYDLTHKEMRETIEEIIENRQVPVD